MGSRYNSSSVRTVKYTSLGVVLATVGCVTACTLYLTPRILAEETKEEKKPFVDCMDPACHDSQEMFRMATEAVQRSDFDFMIPLEKTIKQPAAYTQKESEYTVKDEKGKIHECPPSRELLGRQSWTLLHSIAAYYPDNPSDEEKKYALDFMESFSHLYPCKVCASHLQKSISKYPPKVNSRKEFMIYMCTLHNIVNRTLLKPVYPCNFELLDQRWKSGCPECWSSESKQKMTSEDSMACKDMRKFGVK